MADQTDADYMVQIGAALAAARADWHADLKALAFGLQIGLVEPPWSVESKLATPVHVARYSVGTANSTSVLSVLCYPRPCRRIWVSPRFTPL